MLFVQKQETTTAGEMVSEEADPRYRQYTYQSDGMWTRDGVLQEWDNRRNEDTAKTMIYNELPEVDCDVLSLATVGVIKMTNSDTVVYDQSASSRIEMKKE